jgi:hypothetical protein
MGTHDRLPASSIPPRSGSITSGASIRATIAARSPRGEITRTLAALGIKTVINLTSDDAQTNEESMVEQARMRYVEIR